MHCLPASDAVQELVARFVTLLPHHLRPAAAAPNEDSEPGKLAASVLEQLNYIAGRDFRIGYTKCFLRAGALGELRLKRDVRSPPLKHALQTHDLAL